MLKKSKNIKLLGFASLVLLGTIAISGCSTMEQRDDSIAKKELSPINSKLNFASNWQNSIGTIKNNANIVIAKQKNTIFTADSNGNLFATDNNTGKTIWQAKLDSGVLAGPAVGKNIVAVVSDKATIVAFNNKTGAKLWSQALGAETLAVPTISDNLVIAHSLDGSIFALDATTGKQFWQFNYAIPSIVLRKSSSPVVHKNEVIVGLANGKLISLSKHGGEPNWMVDLAEFNIIEGESMARMSDITSDPIVKDNVAYAVNYQGKLVAVSTRSGQLIWEADVASTSGLTVTNGKVFVADNKGHINAFDSTTGDKLWETATLEGRTLSKPVTYKNSLVLADEDGLVHFLSLENGKQVSRFNFSKKAISSSPVFSKDKMFVLDQSGKIASVAVTN